MGAQYPQEPLWQAGGEVCGGRFSTQSDLPLEPFSLQVSLRGCQGFAGWHGDGSFPQTRCVKGQAGGAFVACVSGRGRGSTVRPQ